MSLPSPLTLTPCLPIELLSYVLQQAYPTALVICGSRTSFLSSVLEATSLLPPQLQSPQCPDPDPKPESSQIRSSPSHSSPSPEENNPSSTSPQPLPQQPPPRYPLLKPTLHQISLSRHTTTVFVPTVSHLRAYLSVFSDPATTYKHVYKDDESPGPPAQSPALVVYGLVELHRGTSEWSTQGLGSTCAALVEAGRRSGRIVVLVEGRRGGGGVDDVVEGGGNDAGDDGNKGDEEEEEADGLRIEWTRRNVREDGGNGIWHEKLPILSGSLRRVGAEVEYGGRTVEVGMVLRRWFKFRQGEWDDGGYG